jgi:hypothetical protein
MSHLIIDTSFELEKELNINTTHNSHDSENKISIQKYL